MSNDTCWAEVTSNSEKMWPDLRKLDTIVHFSNSCLVNIYNLHSQVYSLAKIQSHMSITFGVTALQSSNNRKLICTASIGKINSRRLLKRLLPSKGWMYWAGISTIVFAMNRGIIYWVSLSLYHLSSLDTKVKFVKKNRSRTIVLTSRKQTHISCVSLGLLQQNKDFLTSLE